MGRGGMGEVLAGHDERLHRPVAIKRLRADRAMTEERRERLAQEARLHARLSHPNVVQVYDFVTSDGVDHIVTEYVEGHSLAELCRVERPSPRRALEILAAVASGLDAAHRRGIVHRDLKLENVLLGSDGAAKIADFGIALSDADRPRDAEPGAFAGGTVATMSPEQALGLVTDARSDLFSLGVMAYELLSGVSPFAAATEEQIRENLTKKPHRPLAEIAPAVRVEVSTFVDRLLEKSPELRPSTAREVLERLEALRARERPDEADAAEAAVELRHVAVVSLHAATGRGEIVQVARKLAAWQRRVRETAERYQAHVSGGYGAEQLVCFGYPKKHGDNCAAAATFVSELANDGADDPFSAGIDAGVIAVLPQPSGTVLVGPVLAGANAVGTRATPGTVLVTARAQSVLARSFRLSPVTTRIALEAPDDAGAVAYRLEEPLDFEARGSMVAGVFVGREDALAILRDVERRAFAEGRGRGVVWSGPAGAGKSRLVRELLVESTAARRVSVRGAEHTRFA
ncbi:MAG TPA: serine/threonine-protein kinase, partial [Polyangiaceae bacterium]|nr:serine/threonine-protein kinase [Polyangiaceae bacterium]